MILNSCIHENTCRNKTTQNDFQTFDNFNTEAILSQCSKTKKHRTNNSHSITSSVKAHSDRYSRNRSLTVGLGHTLDLVLLLDGVAIGGTSGGVDDLISQALGNGLDVSERGLAGAARHQVQSLVHATEGGHVHSLSAHNTGGTDAGGVLTGTSVDDGINQDLDGVLVGQDVDQLKGVLHDAHSHHLLTGVSAVSHQGAGQSLNDGAL
jgi:hypothetical protein